VDQRDAACSFGSAGNPERRSNNGVSPLISTCSEGLGKLETNESMGNQRLLDLLRERLALTLGPPG